MNGVGFDVHSMSGTNVHPGLAKSMHMDFFPGSDRIAGSRIGKPESFIVFYKEFRYRELVY